MHKCEQKHISLSNNTSESKCKINKNTHTQFTNYKPCKTKQKPKLELIITQNIKQLKIF